MLDTYIDNSDLGRAMAICQAHEVVSAFYTTPREFPKWEPPWEACRTVYIAWQKSEAARRERQIQKQIEDDTDFVNGVAGGLK